FEREDDAAHLGPPSRRPYWSPAHRPAAAAMSAAGGWLGGMDGMHVFMLFLGLALGAAGGLLFARARAGERRARLAAENAALTQRLEAIEDHHSQRTEELSYQYEQRLAEANERAEAAVRDERSRAAQRLEELRGDQQRLRDE